ncbi:potassium-transporting ATPase subunit KdpC [Tistrella mobilis]|uniref:potassium-transporting ATPase subunit KdpC n=1 Tax=Tistrella mobilis TaxID=171437 RepID=UPI00355668CF
MLRNIRRAVVPLALFSGLLGLAYPLAMAGLAGAIVPRQAEGNPVTDAAGRVVGSALVGQDFTSPGYFHGRPSAVDYDAAAAGASNLGPTSAALAAEIRDRIAAVRAETGVGGAVPGDLVTASGSGLDPDLSPDAVRLQIPRVAKARQMAPDALEALVAAHVERPVAGLIGQPRVNLLRLNMALDAMAGPGAG